tara:strand:- start:266 stop:538 length:273 start_codon:yes stop_codon:yes gene_type:complete
MAHKKGIDILKGRMKSKDDIKKESLKQMMNRLDSYNLPLKDIGHTALTVYFSLELEHKEACYKADEVCEFIKYFHKRVYDVHKNGKVKTK